MAVHTCIGVVIVIVAFQQRTVLGSSGLLGEMLIFDFLELDHFVFVLVARKVYSLQALWTDIRRSKIVIYGRDDCFASSNFFSSAKEALALLDRRLRYYSSHVPRSRRRWTTFAWFADGVRRKWLYSPLRVVAQIDSAIEMMTISKC